MFIFKGKNSNDMGVYVREENFLGKAPMKHDEIHIDGRDGEELIPLGYQNYHGTLNDVVIMNDNFDEVLHWLSGTGELIYKGKKTIIHFLDGYEIKKHKKPFSIPFIRSPFWYALEDDYSEAWGANLIPNGWDSFVPYGSGENYVENWDFNSNDLSQFGGYSTKISIKNNMLYIYETGELGDANARFSGVLPKGTYKVRYKVKAPFGVREYQWFNTSVEKENVARPKSDEFIVYEREFEVIDETKPVRIAFFPTNENTILIHKGNYLYIDWIQITPVDNQHLVVEKTPLENGLTRIQTWGGNDRLKILNVGVVKSNHIFSAYIESKGDTFSIGDGWSIPSNTGNINKGDRSFVTFKYDSRGTDTRVAAREVHNNLDFIASTPTIVEGDTPPTWEADSNPRIINEGTAPSKPLIKLTKGTTNTCEFEVNGVYFKYHFNNDDHVLIDCKEMEATYEGLPRNRHLTIGFEFPVLKPGDNVVKTISGDASISFKRKDSWL